MKQIREGLAGRLGTIAGWQVSAWMLSSPTPPCMYVVPGETSYDLAMQRGLDGQEMRIVALAGLSSEIGAQLKLDELLAKSGATSLKAAVEGDRTLAGVVSDLLVTGASGYRTYAQPGGQAYLGCEWAVTVYD